MKGGVATARWPSPAARPALRHQPSPPGDSAAGTARCASRGCRQVFGLVDAGRLFVGAASAASARRYRLKSSRLKPLLQDNLIQPTRRRFPERRLQCVLRLRFHIPLRGSAGFEPASLFIRRREPTEPTGTTYRGRQVSSTQNVGMAAAVCRSGFSRELFGHSYKELAAEAAPTRAGGQVRCSSARYSALRISISREVVRSKAATRRSPRYNAVGSAAAEQMRLTWRS